MNINHQIRKGKRTWNDNEIRKYYRKLYTDALNIYSGKMWAIQKALNANRNMQIDHGSKVHFRMLDEGKKSKED